MLAEIGAVVALVRKRRGMSLAALATQARCEVRVLEQLEAGQPGISTVQLKELAQSLGLDPEALRQGIERARPLPTVFLRHEGAQDFHSADLDILDEAIEQGRTLHALGVLLQESPSEWPGTFFRRVEAPHDSSEAAARNGYQFATELRKFLGRPIEPIRDIREVVEATLGIAVLVRSLSTRGACAIKAGPAAAIVLSGAYRLPGRARGAIAHEVCHVLHDPDREGVHVVLDLESDRDSLANEQRARAFAAELLLPRAGLNQLLGAPRSVVEHDAAKALVIKAMNHFGASWQVTSNHLCNRGFVDLKVRTWLEALEGQRLASIWDTSLPQVDAPSLLVHARVERAYENALLTDGEARGALGLDLLDPLPWDDHR